MDIVGKISIFGKDEIGYGWHAHVDHVGDIGGVLPGDGLTQTLALWNAIEAVKKSFIACRTFHGKSVEVVSVDGKSVALIHLSNYDTYDELPWVSAPEVASE